METATLHLRKSAYHAGHKRALQGLGLALCCPVTSQVKGYPFEVRLGDNPVVTGVVLADQVKNLDWRARGVRFAAAADSAVVEEVVAKLAALLRTE